MRKKQGRLINVLMKDGTPRRVLMSRAEEMLDKGSAKRYISNTVYRALKLGITVKDPGTRDEDGSLRAAIKAARSKAAAAKHKAEKKAEEKRKAKAQKKSELADMRLAQEVLDRD